MLGLEDVMHFGAWDDRNHQDYSDGTGILPELHLVVLKKSHMIGINLPYMCPTLLLSPWPSFDF